MCYEAVNLKLSLTFGDSETVLRMDRCLISLLLLIRAGEGQFFIAILAILCINCGLCFAILLLEGFVDRIQLLSYFSVNSFAAVMIC